MEQRSARNGERHGSKKGRRFRAELAEKDAEDERFLAVPCRAPWNGGRHGTENGTEV